MSGRHIHLVGLFLALGYLALLCSTASDLAMSRDESFYVSAAESYASWFEVLAAEPTKALLDHAVIDRFWHLNHEHPGLMKSLFGLSWLVQKHWGWFASDSLAFRFPAMVTAGLLVWLITVFGARLWGLEAGVMAAVSFALMPRVFYHAHLNCFDIPIVFFMTLTVYHYWRALEQPRRAPLVGMSFGLALATKHNSWVLPAVLLIHWIWYRWRSERSWNVPWWLIDCLLLGPMVLVLTWPWLWNDGLARFAWYARFHLHHVYYNMVYFGETYFRPPFPIMFPFVLTAFTVPATTLLLSGVGLGNSVVERLRSAFTRAGTWEIGESTVLLFGNLLAPLLLIALPWTPIFGGTKHWFPAYPFLCLFAGYGFVSSLRWAIGHRLKPWFVFGAGALLVAPSVYATAHSHPFGLSHYTALTGGVQGAANLGMNRQFWGFTTGSLIPWIKENYPKGARVWLCDTTSGAWSMLQRDGKIGAEYRSVANMDEADLIMVHHEDHFAEVDYQAWVATQNLKPVHVLTYDGVPIISVYGRSQP